jgi:hypothetical protein
MAAPRKRSPKRKTNVGNDPTTIDEYIAAFCDAPLTRGAVIRLSAQLGRVVATQIRALLPGVDLVAGHRSFAGSNRRHHLDVFIANMHAGLQLGIDVKGLNSAESVGKNWNNRVGDLHELAANHHGNSPKAVLGGVLVIQHNGVTPTTLANIERAMMNLGGRRAYANSYNLLEVASLVAICKERRIIVPDYPTPGSPLRIETYAQTMAEVFRQRWT